MKTIPSKLIILFFLALYLYPLITFFNLITSLKDFHFSDDKKVESLSVNPLANAIKLLNKEDNDKKILTIRQSEIINYTNKEFLHTYDKRMVEILKSSTKNQTLKMLKKLNIGYIMTFFYDDPTYYSTFIKDILNDTLVSTLIYYDRGVYIFKLNYEAADSPQITHNKISKNIKLLNFYTYDTNNLLSHANANFYPYLAPNYCFDGLGNEPEGLNLYKLNLEVEVFKPSHLSINKIHYNKKEWKNILGYYFFDNILNFLLMPIRDFYLQKGTHKISMNFLNNRGAFRLFLSGDNSKFKVKNASIEETQLAPSFKINTPKEDIPLFKEEEYILTKDKILFENGPGKFSNDTFLIPAKSKLTLEIEGQGLFCALKTDGSLFSFLNPFSILTHCYGLDHGKKTIHIDYEKETYLKFILQPANKTVKECWIKIYNAKLSF